MPLHIVHNADCVCSSGVLCFASSRNGGGRWSFQAQAFETPSAAMNCPSPTIGHCLQRFAPSPSPLGQARGFLPLQSSADRAAQPTVYEHEKRATRRGTAAKPIEDSRARPRGGAQRSPIEYPLFPGSWGETPRRDSRCAAPLSPQHGNAKTDPTTGRQLGRSTWQVELRSGLASMACMRLEGGRLLHHCERRPRSGRAFSATSPHGQRRYVCV